MMAIWQVERVFEFLYFCARFVSLLGSESAGFYHFVVALFPDVHVVIEFVLLAIRRPVEFD